MKSPAMKWLMDISWVLSSVAALNMGLSALNFDLLSKVGLTGTWVGYIFGVAGAVSLFMFFTHCSSCTSKS